MRRQLTVTYTKEIVRQANKLFWRRSYTLKALISDSLVVFLFVYNWMKGDTSWLVGLLGTCIIVLLFSQACLYFIPLKRGLARFEEMDSKDAVITLTDEAFSIKSDLGLGEVPWKFIKKVWKFSELWIFFPAESGHFSLPTSGLDTESQEFIVSKIREYGGEVV